MDTSTTRLALDQSLATLCDEFNCAAFTPILESDVAAYIYHQLIAHGCPTNSVYLASRICGEYARSRKPDIVVGNLCKESACVEPVLIAELKVFQKWGHSDQQMRHRISGVLAEDIPTLGEFSEKLPHGRVEILVDFFASKQRRGYMAGLWDRRPRTEVVRDKCREVGASLIWIRPKDHSDDIEVHAIL